MCRSEDNLQDSVLSLCVSRSKVGSQSAVSAPKAAQADPSANKQKGTKLHGAGHFTQHH